MCIVNRRQGLDTQDSSGGAGERSCGDVLRRRAHLEVGVEALFLVLLQVVDPLQLFGQHRDLLLALLKVRLRLLRRRHVCECVRVRVLCMRRSAWNDVACALLSLSNMRYKALVTPHGIPQAMPFKCVPSIDAGFQMGESNTLYR